MCDEVFALEYCPFCGSDFCIIVEETQKYRVKCVECSGTTYLKESIKKAIELWNKRIGN